MNNKKIEDKILKEMKKVVKDLSATKVAKITLKKEGEKNWYTDYSVLLNGEKVSTVWADHNHPDKLDLKWAKYFLAYELIKLLYPTK